MGLLFALDIPSISEYGLTRQVNIVSPKLGAINEVIMKDNVRKSRMVKEHRQDTCNSVTCMTDTCYNNRPKGRAMYQPGTMCRPNVGM